MSKQHEVIINKDECIGCGLCNKDCVSSVIRVEDGKATWNSTGCIFCGHCEAICPKNAVTLTGFTDEVESFDKQFHLDPDDLMDHIKARRTIRQFEDKEVPKAIVKQIIEAGRLAPTGGNSQGTGYTILNKKKDLLESMAVSMFRNLAKPLKPIIPVIKKMEIDDNFFFKKAPLVIVITGSAVNASLAAENMAFMAEANGLGVLFSGFFTMCANSNPKIRKALKMTRKEKVVTTLVIGYPSVKYHRTVRREDAKLRIL